MRRSREFSLGLFVAGLFLTAAVAGVAREVVHEGQALWREIGVAFEGSSSVSLVSDSLRGLKRHYRAAQSEEERDQWAQLIILNLRQFKSLGMISQSNFESCILWGLVPLEVAQKYEPEVCRRLRVEEVRAMVKFHPPS